MDVYMIWATAPRGGEHWLVDAWDDDSIASNGKGWAEAVTKAFAENGAENVRIVKTHVDFDAVVAAFNVPVVASAGIELVR